MKLRKKILSFLLLICMLLTSLPSAAIAVFAADTKMLTIDEDAMEEIKENTVLSQYKQGDTQSFNDDGYIGIPYEVTVYYDYAGKGPAIPGYMTAGATPVILYVVNAVFERIGTDSDVSIITSLIERGYAVAVLDYKNNAKAISPDLEWSAQLLRSKLAGGYYFADKTVFPDGTYQDNVIVPAGYDVLLNDVYFELDKHGTDGTLDKIVNVWNNDFRLYKKDTVIKWVHSDGSRKATQNGFDGSSPVWYSDAAGTVRAEAGEGTYIKVMHTKAESITDCVMADGSPIDLNLYFHAVYPTNPEKDVPVMALFSSAGYLMSGSNTLDRPQFNGFLFKGYAGVMFDYAWIPMGRNDHYGYFDGSSGDGRSVTGDNQSYATYTFNSAQTTTAAMRYIRYLSLSDHNTYRFDINKVGVYGISKAAWMTQLGAPILRENLITAEDSLSDEEIQARLDEKINSFYQQLLLPGHHGETRYGNGEETYTVDGFTVDAGERQPWAIYNGNEISSGAQIVYSSCGAAIDYLCEGYSPMFISVNLQDQYNTGYNMQNILVNIARAHNIPTLWYEADIAHTFAFGEDYRYGVDTYKAFFSFCDYYLKNSPVSVTYTSPINNSVISATSPITVKFIGEVPESEISKITITDNNGTKLNGSWTSAYGNTEWTFIPNGMNGNTVYTLTVPDDLKGSNGVETGKVFTAEFITLPEISSNFELAGENITTNTGGTFFSFTAPELRDDYNQLKLRLRVDNNSVNTLCIYSAASASDQNGALLDEININGEGYYECDVTDYVMEGEAGKTVYFRIQTKTEASEKLVCEESFDTGTGLFTTGSYTGYIQGAAIDGEKALCIVPKTNVGKYGGDHHYYANTTVLTNKKMFNGGEALTRDDLGRTFLITLRVYDTVSRPIRLMLNGITKQSDLLLDYDRVYYTYQTRAGEWFEFTIPYTVYEAKYGIDSIVKQFQLAVNASGDTEMPIYIDHFTVKEIFTDVSLNEISLVSASEGNSPYKAPENTKAFEVNGTFYSTWKEAFTAAGSGDTVRLLRNYILTDLDPVNLSNKASVIIDLNGYKITSENSQNSLIWVSATDKAETNITLVNGIVVLRDTPLISYEGTSSSGSGKTININIQNVSILVDRNSMLTALISAENAGNAVSVSSNITLTDSSLDIKRENLAERSIVLLPAGSDGLSVKYSVIGGSLKINALHEITLCENIIFVSDSENGNYLVMVSSGCSAPVASLKKDGKYSSLALSKTENGYSVYTAEPAAYSTPYGAIPEKYADPDKYPFIIFADEAFLGTASTWQAATKAAGTYLAKNNGKTINILMRADHISTLSPDKLNKMNGSIVLDLDGHTLTRNGTLIEGMVEADYNGNFATSITVKNGILLSESGHFIAFEVFGNTNKQYYMTFDNVTFAVAANSAPQYLITRCWNNSGTGFTDVDMVLNNCTFDFSGKTSGSKSPTSSLTLFDVSNNQVNVSIKINGGSILTEADSLSYVNWYKLSKNGDSIVFEKDEKENYITLSVPAGVAPSLELPTSEGVFGFSELVGQENGCDIYTLTVINEPIPTEYGYIPSEYSGSVFALFMDGRFIDGKTTWADATISIIDILNQNPGKTVNVLMRGDHVSAGAPKRLCNMNGKVVLDLGGHTLTGNANTLFEGGTTNYTGYFDTTFTVKNGTILLGKGSILVFESRAENPKNFDITFDKVKFGLADGYSRDKLFFCYGDKDGMGDDNIKLTFNDCILDLTAINTKVTVFSLNAKTVKSDIHINGGELRISTFDQITWSNNDNETDSITFGKGETGEYTLLTAPAGYNIPVIGGVTDTGTGVIFGNGTTNGESVTYTLTESALATKYGIIPSEYENTADYPFALFSDNGSFITASADWGAASNAAKNYLASNKGKTVYIAMRTDHENKSQTAYFGSVTGNIILDLNGHTLSRGNGKSLIEASTRYMNETESAYTANIVIKNGVILTFTTNSSTNAAVIAYQNYVEYDKTINITFDTVTFSISEKQSSTGKDINTFLVKTWSNQNNVTSVIHSTLIFNSCTFDFSGELAGTVAPGADFKFIDNSSGDNYHIIDININGGKFFGDASGLTVIGSTANDTLTYNKSNDGYTEFVISAGSAPSGNQNTDAGKMVFTKVGSIKTGDKSYTVYHLGKECQYGVIPYEYFSDTENYPFILFSNGTFIEAEKDWSAASSKAASLLSDKSHAGNTVYILLRRDYISDVSAAQLSQINGTLCLDLGGYTMIREKTIFEADARHNHDTCVIVKNGTLLSRNGAIMAANRTTTDGYSAKNFYFIFENITFGLTDDASDVTNLILVSWNDPRKSAEETLNLSIVFTDCTFDLKTVAPTFPVTLINVKDGEESLIDGNITINGGNIIVSSMSNVNIFSGTEEDSLTFGKYEGAYTSLSISNGEIPNIIYDTDEGKAYFKATETAGIYVLTVCDHTGNKPCSTICSVCGGNITPDAPHTYDSDCPNCDSECNVCGEKRNVSHSPSSEWKNDGKYHWHECQNTDCKVQLDKSECFGGEATCIKKAVCECCGQEYGEFGEHKAVSVPGRPATCTDTGLTNGSICSVCEKIISAQTEIPRLTTPDNTDAKKTPDTLGIVLGCMAAAVILSGVFAACRIILKKKKK